MKDFLIISAFLIFGINAFAGEIKGKITGEDGSPIPNVNIILLGTKYGTSSDLDGNFILKDILPAKYKLQASAIGYETKVIEINLLQEKRVEIKIVLKQVAVENPICNSQCIKDSITGRYSYKFNQH
jgi:hypothetical protein